MGRIKSFKLNHQTALNFAVHTYRKRQKDAHFDKHFSMYGVAAEYNVLYKTLRGCIH